MKQSSFFKASLLGLAVFLTACGSSDELGESLTRDYNTYNGEFKSLGSIHVNDTVTHLFEEDDGTILYAYSDRYDLSENLNTRVEAYGVVTTYDNLDKPLFEVKRVGTATDEAETTEAVTSVDYKNAALGVTFTYPSDWTVKAEDASHTLLEAPTVISAVTDAGEADVTATETDVDPSPSDEMEIVKLSAGLTKTSDDTQDDRAAEIRSYVSGEFSALAGITGDLTYIGTDRVVGVRYKLETGDVYEFAPRGTDLFELHYAYLAENDQARIDHTNTFTSLVASFRFIPSGEDDTSSSETDSAVTETPEDTSKDTPTSTPSGDQVTVSKWATLSSNAFEFSMQIPSAWYYVGGSTGYVFDLKEIEDVNAAGVVKLSFNSSTTEGRSTSGGNVVLTKKIESRYYTLSGAAEYETVMQAMLDSIQTTKAS